MIIPEIQREHLQACADAAFFTALRDSRVGVELKRILSEFTDAALKEFVGYRGVDPQAVMALRARWLARKDFEDWLAAEIDSQIEKTEEVAAELGLNPFDLQMRSVFENE